MAYVVVIVFQKRCLLRAHCIFSMMPQSKSSLLDSIFIDTIIPSKVSDEQNKYLRQVIRKHNLPNPCSRLSPSAVCMMYNYFSRNFPKDSDDEAGHSDAQLYVTYRRRSHKTGDKTASGIFRITQRAPITGTVNNSWVVSYCQKLSVMFQCHLNV